MEIRPVGTLRRWRSARTRARPSACARSPRRSRRSSATAACWESCRPRSGRGFRTPPATSSTPTSSSDATGPGRSSGARRSRSASATRRHARRPASACSASGRCSRRRTSSPRPPSSRSTSTVTPSSGSWSSRATATSARSRTARCTRSTTSSARRAATSTSPSAPRPPTSRGRVALLTGGRVKIGYQAGIKLLRAGAQLIVTTRFPRDSAARYAQEPDFADWSHRLEIFGLDLRHTPSVEAFCQHLLETRDRLDFIVNNACQTVRRPPDFYRHMLELETASLHSLPAEAQQLLGRLRGPAPVRPAAARRPGAGRARCAVAGRRHASAPSCRRCRSWPTTLAAGGELFPEGRLDQDLQQVDLRDRNSWRLLLAEVSSVELLETQLVNAVAPFVLNARLKPLMLRTPGTRQAHRQRVGGGGPVLPPVQDHAPPAHEHGEGRAEHDDPHVRDRLPGRRHPHEQRRHRLGDRRGSRSRSPSGRRPSTASTRRSTSSTARRASSIRSSTGANTGNHVWGQFLKDYRADRLVTPAS